MNGANVINLQLYFIYKKQMAQLPILMYHNVSQNELESNGLTISIQN
jgi:hypothetical protein